MSDKTGPIPPLELANVTVGVLTALEEEYAACRDVFDPDRSGKEVCRRATSGNMTCWLCAVPALHGGHHVVAMTLLPDVGNNAAAIAANILLQHCPAIRHLIMCGIAGAVPHPKKADCHVRLGDIVVSKEVIQYDRGKQRHVASHKQRLAEPFAGFDFRFSKRPACPDMLQAVRRIRGEEESLGRRDSRPWESKIKAFIERSRDPTKWKRPRSTKDKLDDSPDGTGPVIPHPPHNSRRSRHPYVFLGSIGSANIVQADPNRRDALRDAFDIRAVEMEGFGIADASWVANVGYLVVRGTCDYCNTNKNDDWHHYAALIAASYARTVIEYLHPIPLPISGPGHDVPTPPPPRYMGHNTCATPHGNVPNSSPVPTACETNLSPSVSSSMANEVDLGQEEAPTSAGTVRQLAAAQERNRPQEGIDTEIRDLNSQLDRLIEEYRWQEVPAVAEELEEQLRLLPRRGRDIRAGWILLSRIETHRLLSDKEAGRTVDVRRLRMLREEAENVVD